MPPCVTATDPACVALIRQASSSTGIHAAYTIKFAYINTRAEHSVTSQRSERFETKFISSPFKIDHKLRHAKVIKLSASIWSTPVPCLTMAKERHCHNSRGTPYHASCMIFLI